MILDQTSQGPGTSLHGGSDDNDGTTTTPFRTIQHAADGMQPGQTCIIHGGRYQETVHVKQSGTVGLPVTFTAAPGEKVIVDGNRTRSTATGFPMIVGFIAHGWVSPRTRYSLTIGNVTGPLAKYEL